MKLFGSTKKLTDKTKNRENVPGLDVVKQFQSYVIQQTINIIKSTQYYTLLYQINLIYYLLNVEPSNLVFLKTYDIKFDEIIMTFTDQNGRLLEREDKLNLALLICKQK